MKRKYILKSSNGTPEWRANIKAQHEQNRNQESCDKVAIAKFLQERHPDMLGGMALKIAHRFMRMQRNMQS
jgi:hypothetical protein